MNRRVIGEFRNQNISSFARSFGRYAHRVIDDKTIPLQNIYFSAKHGQGEPVMDRDWDNLILYDACRYDEFCRVCPVNQDATERRISVASKTPEFLHKNFDGKTFNDIVYITANPQPLKYVAERPDNPFYEIISLLDEWESSSQTIPPRRVYDAASRIGLEYPNKRLIIHFLQPHAPFIGPTAAELRNQTGKTLGGIEPGRSYTALDTQDIDTTSYRGLLDTDGVTIEKIRKAYRETLAIATNYTIALASNLEGKTAMTADHGELLGERLHQLGVRRWEHPMGVKTPELSFVPWVEFPHKDRKNIQFGRSDQGSDINQEAVNERLQSLGYVR